MVQFRPNHWKRDYHRLEITAGEVLPDQEIPLLKSRREQSRAEVLKLWEEDQCGLDALQSPMVAATITQTITPQTRLCSGPVATCLPMSRNLQSQRYRLVDHYSQPQLEMDEHFDSIEETWSLAIRWWQQQQPAGELVTASWCVSCRGGGPGSLTA